MKNTTFVYLIFSLIAFSYEAYAQDKNVALAKLLKGEVKSIDQNGETKKLNKGDWIKEGSIIKTEGKSFVQLSFIDKSIMNVGPSSEVKIERFNKSEPGVINVLKGKIRSQVTKNYLEMEKDKSKLFIKSKSAVMGIRGTDFLFTTSGATGNTTAVLFEGSVVFNHIGANQVDNSDLESIVSRGRRIMPGQFSVANISKNLPTVPAKLSSQQFNNLFKNANLNNDKNNERKKITATRSAVPPGLSGAVVSGSGEGITKGLRKIGSLDIQKNQMNASEIESSKGYIKGDDFKPVDGSLVHLESGTIIPIPKDAEFDKATGEWISGTNGGSNKDGSYTAPEGYQITDEGRMIKDSRDQELQKKNQVVEVIIEAKPLDQNVNFDKLPTVIVNSSEVQHSGHHPAAGGEADPVVEPLKKEVPTKERGPSGESDLPAPPLPVGTTYRPQTYNVAPPSAPIGNTGVQGSRTQVRFRIRNP